MMVATIAKGDQLASIIRWSYFKMRSGIEFPERLVDEVPINAPPVTQPPPIHGMPGSRTATLEQLMAADMESLSLLEIKSLRRATDLLSDMLQAINPYDREAVRGEVIVDLINCCRSSQRKLAQCLKSTRNEELLAQGLALNDNLQRLLAKHDFMASRTKAIMNKKVFDHQSSKTTASTAKAPGVQPLASFRNHVDEDDDDDDFTQLARRRSRSNSAPCRRSSSGEDHGINATSGPCRALAVADPPIAARTRTKDQDMTDLLGITLCTNPSPHTPQPPANYNHPVQNQVPLNSFCQQYNPIQGQTHYGSYVVPWAQPHPYDAQLESSRAYANVLQLPLLRHYNLFGSRGRGSCIGPSVLGEAHATSSLGHEGPSPLMRQCNSIGSTLGDSKPGLNPREVSPTGPKEYVPTYKLFEDLIDLKSIRERLKTGSTSGSLAGRSMVGERK